MCARSGNDSRFSSHIRETVSTVEPIRVRRAGRGHMSRGGILDRVLGDRSMTVKTSFAAGCVGIVAILVAVLSINRMSALRDDLQTMKNDHVDSLQQVATMYHGLAAMYRGGLV